MRSFATLAALSAAGATAVSALSHQSNNPNNHIAKRDHHQLAERTLRKAGMQRRVRRQNSASNSTSSSEYSTTAIWYAEAGWITSCGETLTEDDSVVGLPLSLYPNVYEKSDLCGKQITAVNTATGASVTATVIDASNRDDYTIFSSSAFTALGGDLDVGELAITFSFADGTIATTSAAASSSASSSAGDSSSSAAATTKSAPAAGGAASAKVASTSEAIKLVQTTTAAPTTTEAPATTEAPKTTTTSEWDSDSYYSSSSKAAAAAAKAASSSSAEAYNLWAASSSSAEAKASADAAWAASSSSSAAAKASADAAWASSSSASAAKASASAAASSSSDDSDSSSSSGSSKVYSGGIATYFFQNGVAGNCGTVNSDSTLLVALPTNTYAGGKYCGQYVTIKRMSTGKTIKALVADSCPTCENDSCLDLSEGAYQALGGTVSEGVFDIQWWFN
ncbi:hypothetical protein JCM10207_004852 [Rhodosporidiobolus poonsookiae]